MSHSPSITEALAGAVLFGDLTPEQGRAALLSGLPAERPCFPATVEGAAAAQRAGAGALLLSMPLIPRKVGAFWGPQPYTASEATRLAEKHVKGAAHAFRWGAGIRGNLTVGALTCIAVEADSTSLQEQAELLDYLDAEHGIRAGLVVMSGDTRPDSLRRLPLLEGVNTEPGKSLHVFLPIHAVDTSNADHRRCLEALCVLLRADLAATDHCRLMRAPGVVATKRGAVWPAAVRAGESVRVQTLLRAEASPVDVADLADKLEAACDELGLDVAEGIAALEGAVALRNVAGRLRARAGDEKGGERAATLATAVELGTAAAEVESCLRMTVEAVALLSAHGGAGTGRKGAGTATHTLGGFSTAKLDRDFLVPALLPSGERKTLPFWRWPAELAALNLGGRPGGGELGLKAWAPTDAGLRHTSGDNAGTPRETPAGTLWRDGDVARLSCYVDRIVYTPSLPADPAAQCPRLPGEGESPYLDLQLTPGVTVLRSDTGSGKTTALIEAMRGQDALVVSPRVAISQEAAVRYGARFYRAVKGLISLRAAPYEAQAELWKTGGRVSVCINSIGRVSLLGAGDGGPFWLVLEESEQITAALYSETIGDDKAGGIVQALTEAAHLALESGGGVVAADAFAGDLTRALLREIAGGVEIREQGIARRRGLPVSFWKGARDAKGVMVTSGYSAQRAACVDAVAAGKRLLVASFSKGKAKALGSVLAQVTRPNGEPARVKVYLGRDEHKGDHPERAELSELRDVNKYWGPEECDVVIFSPVVSAAVSYDRAGESERFNIAALDAPQASHADWTLGVQMLDRARRVDEVWIAAPERNAWDVADLGACRELIVRKWDADVKAYAKARGRTVTVEACDPGLVELKAVVQYVGALRGADIEGDLRRYFEARGATIVQARAEDPGGAESIRKAVKEVADRDRAEWAQKVSDAAALRSDAERVSLERRAQKLPLGAEKDAALAELAGHTIDQRYGRELRKPELVDDDRNGAVWRGAREFTRLGLIADGESARALDSRLHAIIAAGTSSAARGDDHKTRAAGVLLCVALGADWLAEALEPLRLIAVSPGRGGEAREEEPCGAIERGTGDTIALARQWRAGTWDGRELARQFAAELHRHGIDPRVLKGSGLAVGAVAVSPVKAVGRALRRIGLKAECERGGTGARERVRRLDMTHWRRHCERSDARNRALRENPVEPFEVRGVTASTTRLNLPISLRENQVVDAQAHTHAALPMLSLFPPRSPRSGLSQ